MHPAGGNADLRPHAKLAAIGKLGRGIVQKNGRVDLVEEALNNRIVFGRSRPLYDARNID